MKSGLRRNVDGTGGIKGLGFRSSVNATAPHACLSQGRVSASNPPRNSEHPRLSKSRPRNPKLPWSMFGWGWGADSLGPR